MSRMDATSEEAELAKAQRILQQVIEHVAEVHRWAAVQRRKLYDAELTIEGRQFSALFELEMLSDLVHGYAASAVKRGALKEPVASHKKLMESDPFSKPEFCAWMSSVGSEYPRVCVEIEMLDYLRRRLLEFIDP